MTASLLLEALFRRENEPSVTTMRRELTDNVEFFCEQQGLLAADPWFHELRTWGDAGPLLNAWVGWEQGQREMPKDSPLVIPAHLPQPRVAFQDWLTSSVEVSSLDFRWMEQLHAYDHWDVLKNTPLPPREPLDWIVTPMPDFGSLRRWSQFRLLHGLRTGQPLQAARDVRHLAWLMFRTDTVRGALDAGSLLRLEHEAFAATKEPPPEWKPMSPEQVKRMEALLISSIAFSSIAAPVEVARKARRCGEPVVTRCAALGEAASFARYMKPLAQDAYAEGYTVLEEDIEAFPCPVSTVRMLWERGVTIEELEPGSGRGISDLPSWMRKLSWGLVDAHLSSIVIPRATPSIRKLEDLRKKHP
ncbi:hypothetical protein [Hyalangium rubrum]|uniref:Uncharacterized protein n=1 Tax=Hyalangium rubrum TaxID=3103134 RepID=A0ABU5HIA1_9BACT|nr:hypothetical protein [Hyalangium sp. s54d21]MDY7233196.1 hypothetical protein [Hyalangium sp. s54d21]